MIFCPRKVGNKFEKNAPRGRWTELNPAEEGGLGGLRGGITLVREIRKMAGEFLHADPQRGSADLNLDFYIYIFI